MQEWQSIEAAPKDGTNILVWDGVTMTTAWWWEKGGYWRLVDAGEHAEDDQCTPQPTHWMPLPEPPPKNG